MGRPRESGLEVDMTRDKESASISIRNRKQHCSQWPDIFRIGKGQEIHSDLKFTSETRFWLALLKRLKDKHKSR